MSITLATLRERLDALNFLSTPVWLFDIEQFAMRWANLAALQLWSAQSLEELLARDFGNVTDSTRIRLHSYIEGFAHGKSYVERWTFYPKGAPVQVVCHCSKSPFTEHPNFMLVEAAPVSTEGDGDALRMVEALRHTQVMISLYSMDGKPVLRNPASIKIYGPTGAEGDTLWSHFNDPQEVEKLKSALSSQQVYTAELEQNTLSGKRWLAMDARVTKDPVTGEELILMNKIDISRRRAAEEMRSRAIMEAENASRARSRFLANVSHELRTPMNGVIGMTSLLLGTRLDAEQKHFVETIQSSGESLLSIINDILDISKIDAGQLELHEQPYDLVSTVRSVVDIVSGALGNKPLRIQSEFGTGLPERQLGDANRIKQILLNLVSNAVKFTPSGSVTISVRLVENNNQRVHIEVRDTGIGIAEADQPKLFKSFSQVDSRDSRPFNGTGLGLAISKQLVTMMQGTIGLQSRLGEGSTFFFELPLKNASANVTYAQPAPVAATTDHNTAPRSLRILLVEDNVVNQRVAVYMLSKLGHKVDVADDGRKAIDAASTQRYDLIFMDVQLPEIDGYGATGAIRASGGPNASTPIVALTANAMEGDERQCLAAGMDGYLSKPLVSSHFVTAIGRYAKT